MAKEPTSDTGFGIQDTSIDDNSQAPHTIDLALEVPGTPEQVWRAIATGPGITSWYVPHQVEGQVGGACIASFGPEPEMKAPGRVAAWEPPRRVVFDGGEDQEGTGLAFEWLVEAKNGSTCIVRLVNTGFGSGGPWDDQYEGMLEGWATFLHNLNLHLLHFGGQTSTTLLPMAMWNGSRESTWEAVTAKLGFANDPSVGDRLEVTASDAPPLGGTVTSVSPFRVSLLLDEPAPGTGFVAVEGYGTQMSVSVWLYLYGDDAEARGEQLDAQWRAWLTNNAT